MRHYEIIHTEDTRGFHVIFSVTPEDCHPRDCFDYTEEELADLCDKINRGVYAWFAARVEVYQQGVLLGSDFLGGCLYDSPMQFVRESEYYEDMVNNAIQDAKSSLEKIYAKFDYNQYFPTEEEFSRAEIERIITLHDMTISDELIKLAKACFAEAKIKEVTI
jgi:hypothetical protein